MTDNAKELLALAERNAPLTRERLKQVLSYEEDTGLFRWKKSRGCCMQGTVAGALNNHGHRRIKIDRRAYYAHRLAWLYCYGESPKDEIDHINGLPDDNRLSNLRQASHAQNNGNRGPHSNNKLGVKGVTRYGDSSFHAQIKINGKQTHLGYFPTIEEADQAYRKAALAHFGEFARFERPERSRP